MREAIAVSPVSPVNRDSPVRRSVITYSLALCGRRRDIYLSREVNPRICSSSLPNEGTRGRGRQIKRGVIDRGLPCLPRVVHQKTSAVSPSIDPVTHPPFSPLFSLPLLFCGATRLLFDSSPRRRVATATAAATTAAAAAAPGPFACLGSLVLVLG